MSSARVQPDQAPVKLSNRPVDEIAMHLLERLFSQGASGQLRGDLIELGRTLAPQELGELYKFVDAMTTKDGRAQFASMAPMWSQLTNGIGATYAREELFDGTMLYRSAVQAEKRSTIICFTSIANGMFMPNCRFLEMLGRHPVDIVINMTESGTFGLWQLGASKSFAESLFTLKSTLADRGISTDAYVGASAGGGPAVHAAALDAGTRAVLFAGRFYAPGRRIQLKQAGPAFEPVCDCWQGAKPQVYSIYGALNPLDATDDDRLRALLPTTKSYPIPNDKNHGPTITLTARRKLQVVMDLIFQVASGVSVDFDEVVRS